MSEFKGTPGPYKVTEHCTVWTADGYRLIAVAIGDGRSRDVKDFETVPLDREMMRFNAHLLAASWEMFEALRELAAIFLDEQLREFVFGLDHDISLAARVELAHRAARAAIAKALGEQP